MNFILTSIIASVVLTLLINFLPLLLPNATATAHRKLEEDAPRTIEQHEDDDQSRPERLFGAAPLGRQAEC